MNFQDLMNKMRELDAPVTEASVEECGEPMGMTPPAAEHTTPPSMSVNLNAQGMDDIAELMKLITKVNPDMEKPAGGLPSLVPPGPSITPSLPPLKMLPDLDADNDKMPGGEMDKDDSPVASIQKAMGDVDGDGDHDMDDHDAEKDQEDEATDPDSGDDEDNYRNYGSDNDGAAEDPKGYDDDDQKEASPAGFDQASTSPDPEFQDADFMLNKLAGGLNRPKTMHKHGYQQGDNPMAMNDSDLRASIRAELLTRLAEAKAK
jgi:hypothetical protein